MIYHGNQNLVFLGSSGNERMRITPAGFVGIGASSLAVPLTVTRAGVGNNSITGAITIYAGQSSGSNGGGVLKFDHSAGGESQNRGAIINSIEDGGTFGQSVGLAFQTGQNNFVERMRITAGGRVGIGTTTPSNGILHVSGSINSTISTGWFFNNSQVTSNLISNGSSSVNVSIYGTNFLWAEVGFITSSDNRIKKNFQDISDGQALEHLRAIEPKTYEYVDTLERGSNKVYGFSAQQVSNVLPYAVVTTSGVVPDIYDLADVSGTLVTLRTKTFDYTDVSATVNIILRETGKKDVSANFQPPNQIVLHESLGTDISDVFVYGRRVNDFHTLDKNAIFTVNVAATQELDRQLQAAKGKISQLEDTLSNVITRLSALEQPA
jgi:hypothetical protein